MYTIIQQGDTVESYVIECMCDTREDIKTLPTSWKSGSSCIVIEDSSVWMLNNKKEWAELK